MDSNYVTIDHLPTIFAIYGIPEIVDAICFYYNKLKLTYRSSCVADYLLVYTSIRGK